MAGIALTEQRRSQLLQELLRRQNQQRPQIRSGVELAARLLAQGIRQKKVKGLREEEAAADKTRGANQNAVVAALVGDPTKSVFGTDLPQNTSVEQAISQLPNNDPLRQLVQSQIVGQKFAVPKDDRTTAQKEFQLAREQGFQGTFLEYKKAIAEAGRSSVTVNNGPKTPSGFRFEDPESPQTSDLEPIPGGPQDSLNAEQAAKVQLIETALSSQQEFQKFIFNDNGGVNRGNIFNMMLNTPFTEGRSANVFLLDSIEAKLRAESGAAVPESEVKRAGKRFRPSTLDSDATIRVKADLLGDFLEGAFNKVQRDGRFDLDRTLDALDGAAKRRLKGSEIDSMSDEELEAIANGR